MRTADYENKQRAGAAAVAAQAQQDCKPMHRLYLGRTCPTCARAIPIGPHTAAQRAEFLDERLFIGSRPANELDPAEAANPVTAKETQLREELAVATKRLETARFEHARVAGVLRREELEGLPPAGADPDAYERTLFASKIAEAEVERLARAARAEAAQRAGRIRLWISRHRDK